MVHICHNPCLYIGPKMYELKWTVHSPFVRDKDITLWLTLERSARSATSAPWCILEVWAHKRSMFQHRRWHFKAFSNRSKSNQNGQSVSEPCSKLMVSLIALLRNFIHHAYFRCNQSVCYGCVAQLECFSNMIMKVDNVKLPKSSKKLSKKHLQSDSVT